MRARATVSLVVGIGIAPGVAASAGADPAPSARSTEPASIVIPRVDRPPRLEDFLAMKPDAEWDGKLVKVDGFTQIRPGNGAPPSQRTEALLGYDHEQLYVIFLCFDTEPDKIRARLVPREAFVDQTGGGLDDLVSISLDTFHDRRRGYAFQVNPFGVQWDALFSESTGFDASYDAVWYSRGVVTAGGYVVWVAIPFKSLRFRPEDGQTWGVLLNRDIPRNNESLYWPRFDTNLAGYMNKAADMSGLAGIAPGRNAQLVPYDVFRSFRALDLRNPSAPMLTSTAAESRLGIDAKAVVQDRVVVDATLHPDFSQVESDQPQETVNQRFEVFFPEKRPFFLENAAMFQTPNTLVFTRRISDPTFGVRVTGKTGGTAFGALVADDAAPGETAAAGSALDGRRAHVTVARIAEDVFAQSSAGVLYTDRELAGAFNRVAGADAHLRLRERWTVEGQAALSVTSDEAGGRSRGEAYDAIVTRTGRQLHYRSAYDDRTADFVAQLGFVPRTDVREATHQLGYDFRPEGPRLISWGPQVQAYDAWDHEGHHVNRRSTLTLASELVRAQQFSVSYTKAFEVLGPRDNAALDRFRQYPEWMVGFEAHNRYYRPVVIDTVWQFGTAVNISPTIGTQPEGARQTSGNVNVSVRPTTRLRLDGTYLFLQLDTLDSATRIVATHTIRTTASWQFTTALSMRSILQYDGVAAAPLRTSLPTTKRFNVDALMTCLVHPGTALYVGYNSDFQNVDLPGTLAAESLIRGARLTNDSRGLFVKASYLVRL
jgi:uncharacterized protein DUF5916